MPHGPAVPKIPEEEQHDMRRRLRMMRESIGLKMTDIGDISVGTVGHYELHDLSTMTFAALRKFALTYGMDLHEFVKYLAGENEHIQENRALIRSMNYLRSMDPERQKVASDILGALAGYNHKDGEKD